MRRGGCIVQTSVRGRCSRNAAAAFESLCRYCLSLHLSLSLSLSLSLFFYPAWPPDGYRLYEDVDDDVLGRIEGRSGTQVGWKEVDTTFERPRSFGELTRSPQNDKLQKFRRKSIRIAYTLHSLRSKKKQTLVHLEEEKLDMCLTSWKHARIVKVSKSSKKRNTFYRIR